MRPDLATRAATVVGRHLSMGRGQPWPLGSHWQAQGVQFAVWAPDATRVDVCLFNAHGERELARISLPACTDGVWHGCFDVDAQASDCVADDGAGDALVYGYRVFGPWSPLHGHRFNPAKVLLDPYAAEVVGRYAGDLSLYIGHDLTHDPAEAGAPDVRDNAALALKSRVRRHAPAPLTPPEAPRVGRDEAVFYEVHVKGATRLHPDVPEALRGSYAGLAHPAMLAHLRALGVTTLSLLPVHARADEARLQGLGLSNYWGYSSIGFFAPEPRYASGRPGVSAPAEFRQMVADLHAGGFEVVLDVVYNHTAETDELGPTLSLRGLANARYYHLEAAPPHRYVNWSGCGNCLNLTEPRVVQLVVDSLRHWVLAYGVDGFRFDLAPILARGRDGQFSRAAGFFAALQADPVLSRVKLIAEPWDIGPGGYQVGGFPPGWQEWNDQFRDTLRGWWLRGAGDRGVFAHRFAGSSTQFRHDGRAPTAGVNFITAHDGFTLRDLVSHDHKHNDANGEHNRDGHHHNISWNCGVEGATDQADVLALRARLQRALLCSLVLAQGTPMLLAGDEIGHSQRGNNNAYCQDNTLTWLDWPGADTALRDFTARLLRLRREQRSLRIGHWLTGQADAQGRTDVLWWHPDGHPMDGADWGDAHERTLGVRLEAAGGATPALMLVNPHPRAHRFVLPPGHWLPAFCSAASDGQPEPTLLPRSDDLVAPHGACSVPARSVLVLLDNPG